MEPTNHRSPFSPLVPAPPESPRTASTPSVRKIGVDLVSNACIVNGALTKCMVSAKAYTGSTTHSPSALISKFLIHSYIQRRSFDHVV